MGLLLGNYLKRPEWLYYPGVDLRPIKQFTFEPRLSPGPQQLELCRRLISAYKTSLRQEAALATASELWKLTIRKKYRGLLLALEGEDPKGLAESLAGMFQEPFLYGISSAHLGLDVGHAPFIQMKLTEELLALAESLALVRTETPEQGVLGFGLSDGLGVLIRKIEERLGISMDFPRVGGVYGFDVNGVLLMPEAPEHIYVASRISEAMGRHQVRKERDPIRIVEIGAGFGGTAYWLSKLNKEWTIDYTIIDLPMMHACQGYFLAQAFGAEAIQFYGEPAKSTHKFRIIPPHAKAAAAPNGFDMLINENSMPEMPEAVVEDYLIWARTKLPHLFYSYNQEAFSPVSGIPQTLVPNVVAKVGGYSRLSRNYSWVRRGYVEEIYSAGHS